MDFSGELIEVRFSFNFDLSVELLKHFYLSQSAEGYRSAWADIKSFMEKNDFIHSQYSGYESVSGMSYAKAYIILEDLNKKFPWFANCASAATLTEIGDRYNVLDNLKAVDIDVISPPSDLSK